MRPLNVQSELSFLPALVERNYVFNCEYSLNVVAFIKAFGNSQQDH